MWRRRKSWRHRPTGPDPGATSEKKIYLIWKCLGSPQLLFELQRGRGRIFAPSFVSPSHIPFFENTIKFACGTGMACSHLGGRTFFPMYYGRHTIPSPPSRTDLLLQGIFFPSPCFVLLRLSNTAVLPATMACLAYIIDTCIIIFFTADTSSVQCRKCYINNQLNVQ